MGTTSRFRCSVQSCVHDAIIESGDIMCPEHWERLSPAMQARLWESRGTQAWLRLARIATESVDKEVERLALLEGFRPPKAEFRGVA